MSVSISNTKSKSYISPSFPLLLTRRTLSAAKFQSCIGCFAIFIVVGVTALLGSAISEQNVLFLLLAENTAAQIDMQLTPQFLPSLSPVPTINYTAFATIPKSAPRIEANAYLLNCGAIPNWAQCLTQSCLSDQMCIANTLVELKLIDTQRENQMQLGRRWSLPAPAAGEVHISTPLAISLDLGIGDQFTIAYRVPSLFASAHAHAMAAIPSLQSDIVYLRQYVYANLTIAGMIGGNEGRFSTSDTNIIYLEYNLAQQSLTDGLGSHLDSTYSQIISTYDLYSSATTVNLNYPGIDRAKPYLQSFNTALKAVSDWATQIAIATDFNAVSTILPVMSAVVLNQTFSSFIGLIFTIVTLLLTVISIYLVYTLMMVSVDTRTFEMGVLRMVGLNRGGLIIVLLVQAMAYALPAWVIGLIVAQIGYTFLQKILMKLVSIQLSSLLSWEGCLLSSALGLLVPIVSAILPIKAALGTNLHDALDNRHSKVKAVAISMERNTIAGVSSLTITLGCIMTIFGFVCYYLFPLSIVYKNITLMFNIMTLLLVSMLVALTMLALNAEPLIERGFLWLILCILWMENKAIPILVRKNLLAHRSRNRKTTIMYAITLGAVMFIVTAVASLLGSLAYTQISAVGAPIVISSSTISTLSGQPLGIQNLPTLTSWLSSSSQVKAYSYASYDLTSLAPSISYTHGENLGRLASVTCKVQAASANLFDGMFGQYAKVNAYDKSLAYAGSLANILYADLTQDAILVGSALITTLGLKGVGSRLLISNPGNTAEVVSPVRVAATLDSCPKYSLKKYFGSYGALVSFPTLSRIAAKSFNVSAIYPNGLPLRYIYITPVSTLSPLGVDALISAIRKKVSPGETVIDARVAAASNQSLTTILNLIFLLITAIVMVMGFFSLNGSMYVNVKEQAKEIGMMRALGVRRGMVFRTYAYESFVLIISAAFLGIAIGSVLGWSISSQLGTLMNVPSNYSFPSALVTLILVMSICCALGSTIGPVYQIVVKEKLISVLRG